MTIAIEYLRTMIREAENLREYHRSNFKAAENKIELLREIESNLAVAENLKAASDAQIQLEAITRAQVKEAE